MAVSMIPQDYQYFTCHIWPTTHPLNSTPTDIWNWRHFR